jgi:hypothetical protein
MKILKQECLRLNRKGPKGDPKFVSLLQQRRAALVNLLRRELADGKPHKRSKIMEAAVAQGISPIGLRDALEVARKHLAVTSSGVGRGSKWVLFNTSKAKAANQ